MKKEINDDCPTHGKSEKAKRHFWDNPLTSHWACKCKGIGRTQAEAYKVDLTVVPTDPLPSDIHF